MADQTVEALVNKLILLQQKVGTKVHHDIKPPFITPFHDYLSIQDTAKDIADFIDLDGFTFIVAVTKQKENVGGHIDLSTQGNSVFVEIDSDMMKFPDAIAAALCHELCHKWLQVNRIHLPDEAENEILTDITCVFLGLGRIMLNGCKATKVRYENCTDGATKITETNVCGYLNRDQFALVYRLVCAMRNIPKSEMMLGLEPDASQAMRDCQLFFGQYFDGDLYRPENVQESVHNCHAQITDLQYTLADLNKHADYLRYGFLNTIDRFIKSCHKETDMLGQNASAMAADSEVDPVLRFLRPLQREHALRRMRDELASMDNEASAFLKRAISVCRYFSRFGDQFPPPSADMFTIVTCPKDGQKLRLPDKCGKLIATCPSCKYRFAYNTKILEFVEPTPTLRTRLAKLFGKTDCLTAR